MARRFKISMKKGVNVSRVITKIVATVLILYVGGLILNEVGSVMNGTTSQFNQGLKLIGWEVTAGQITDTTTGTGLLTVVGLIAVASIVMEFVRFKL